MLTGSCKRLCINRDDACLKTISDHQDTNGKGNSDGILKQEGMGFRGFSDGSGGQCQTDGNQFPTVPYNSLASWKFSSKLAEMLALLPLCKKERFFAQNGKIQRWTKKSPSDSWDFVECCNADTIHEEAHFIGNRLMILIPRDERELI